MVIPIAKSEAPPVARRSRWFVWTSAAHRVLFLPGAVQLVATLALVAWDVGGRNLGLWATPLWVLPPAWSHGYLMLFGLFPWFIFGFAMTAVPNWTNVRLPRSAWLACAFPMIAGLLVFYAGLLLHPGLVVAGGFLQLAGWLAGTFALARIVFAAGTRDAQAISIVVLLAVGAAAGAVFLAGIGLQEAGYAELAGRAGVWLFLLPLFLVVSHRLVPFFSSRVLSGYAMYRPAFSLPLLGAACVAHFLLESLSLAQWTWIADAPMAAWVGWLAWKWGITQSFRARLLAMLHVSLAVLAAALVLYALASLATLAGHPGLLGRGALHLLGVGYFAAMTLGMVSRVSLGHSGRALEADAGTWYSFIGVIGVGVTRALADFAPFAGTPRTVMLALVALAWIAILGSWALRFIPLYVRPRADGRPG